MFAGATGFEPVVFPVTGGCVKPGYTTRPDTNFGIAEGSARFFF